MDMGIRRSDESNTDFGDCASGDFSDAERRINALISGAVCVSIGAGISVQHKENATQKGRV